MLKKLKNLKDFLALDKVKNKLMDDLERIERLSDSKTYDKDQDISI